MDIQKIKADKLIPAIYNPRKNLKKGDAEYKKIERSILEFGYVDPIIVNKDMTIIGGHQRYKVLVNLGYDELDCVVVDLPKDREKALNIALNKISGEWDEALLIDLLGDLGDLTELTGFDAEELDKLFDNKTDVQEDDFDADAALADITEPVTKRGDIWQLGRHRLMCGDSTMIDDVDGLMDGKKADMVFTDPPYGVEYTGGLQFKDGEVEKNNRQMIKNDESDDIYTEVIPVIASICNGPCYTWFAGTKASKLYTAVEAVGDIHSLIIWVKNGGYGALNANYKQKHEPCLYWKPKGKKLNFVGATTETTIWEICKDGINKLHPTQKPVELAAKAIKNHSAGLIVDLFGGSGSTLIACEQLNRTCYMMELDPVYCDVIIKRWEEFTGQKAELIS